MIDARVHEPLLDDRGRYCLLNPLCSIPLAARSLDFRERVERRLRLSLWLKASLRQQGDEGSGEYRMAGSNYTSVQ